MGVVAQNASITEQPTNAFSSKLNVISRIYNGLGIALLLARKQVEVPNVIPKTVRNGAFLLVSATCVANPSTHANVRSHYPSENPMRNPRKMKFVVYTNKKYRFRFSLPGSWRGYSIFLSKWQGGDGRTYQPGVTMPPPEKGPLLVIRHPPLDDEQSTPGHSHNDFHEDAVEVS